MLLSGGAQFVLSVAVGRLLGPSSLGVVRASLSLATTGGLLWPAAAGQGASLFVARELAGERPAAAGTVARHMALRTAGSLAILAPTLAAASMLLFGFAWWDAVWVAALVVALGGYHVARGIRFGRGAVARATLVEGLNAALSLGLLAVVIAWRAPGWLLAPLVVGNFAYAAGPVVGAVCSRGRLAPDQRRELDRFVLWGVAGSLASAGLLQISMVVAKAIAPTTEAGLYAAAISLATPLSLLARALSMALFPELARLRGAGDEEAGRAVVDRATRGLIAFMTPSFLLLVAVADPLVRLVYGEGFVGAVEPLRILLLAVLLTTIPVAAVNSLSVTGADGVRLTALLAWVGLALGLGVMAVLAPLWGIQGVALAYLVGAGLTATLSLAWAWRRGGHRWTCPVAAAALAAGLVWGVTRHPAATSPLVALGCGMLMVSVWSVSTWLFMMKNPS